jgi:phosphoribosyl-ATP pyrophosphohydrolase
MPTDTLDRLTALIGARRAAPADASYTRQLLDAGPVRVAKKFGEEAIEFALATAAGRPDEVTAEAADVLYHLLVALESRNIVLADVLTALERRMGQSGLAEKASRPSGGPR